MEQFREPLQPSGDDGDAVRGRGRAPGRAADAPDRPGLAPGQPDGRAGGPSIPPGEVLQAGPLEVRPGERTALADGRPLTLTVRELQLLTALARRPERVVSRPELYASVWEGPLRASDRSVDVYVSKLRAKLEEALPAWRYIHTHFGFGYRFSPRPLHDFHRSLTQR